MSQIWLYSFTKWLNTFPTIICQIMTRNYMEVKIQVDYTSYEIVQGVLIGVLMIFNKERNVSGLTHGGIPLMKQKICGVI